MGCIQGFFSMDGNFDLLGDPIPDGWGKRGRPPHMVTVQNRCKVMLLLAVGRKNHEIAAALGISEPTLRKNYFREMRSREEAKFRLEGVRLLRIYEQVEEGNVGAIKELGKVLEKADRDSSPLNRANVDPSIMPPKLGKKEKAFLDAQRPDTTTTLGELMAQRQGRPN
jgi:hypothetical protein